MKIITEPITDSSGILSHFNLKHHSLAFINDSDINEASKSTYRRALKQFFLFLGTNALEHLSDSNIYEYKNYLKGRELSTDTVCTYMAVVRRFFTWIEAKKIYPNIASSVKGIKKAKGFRKDCLTIDQTKDVVQAIDQETVKGRRDFAIINTLLRTGLRVIEIQRADICDISQSGGEATLYIQGKGRNSKDDFVVLTNTTLKPIMNYLNCRPRARGNEPLFASLSDRNAGKRMTTRSISRITKNAFMSAGINSNRLSAHSLRHTAITTALLAGASIQEVKAMARHDNINTTLIYSHNINRLVNSPERKIDDYLEKHNII